MKRSGFGLSLLLLILLSACEEQPLRAVGQLASDRVELTAEFAEPIIRIAATEGDMLAAGQLVIVQNDERVVARIEELEANIRRIEALLAEQLAGPRQETIEVARAQVREQEIGQSFRQRELERLTALRDRSLTSEESVDAARTLAESAAATLEAARARLRELDAGTRPEQIGQTRHSLEQAQAQLALQRIERTRYSVTAPVAGSLDSLPVEEGERPTPGEVVAVILTGAQPHARVYVPEPVRVHVQPGDRVQVRVDGLESLLDGTVRRISSEASFTPYFALTESDRSRLSYVAEIALPPLERRLPDGVPVEAWFRGMEVPDDE